MQIRVYYEDTDIGGVVYHANYLKYCERARSELFFQKGETPMFEGGHFMVRHLEADFYRAAKLGDLLEVTVELLEVKAASLRIRQQVMKEGFVLFEVVLKLAYVTRDGSVGRLDADKRLKLSALLEV